VQFKSRTEKKIVFPKDKFRSLLDQELAVFIAKVNLKRSEVELFSIGSILCHPNTLGCTSLTLHISKGSTKPEGDELHGFTGDPILKWDVTQTENPEFQQQFYQILKAWLLWDRNNRKVRKTGMQRIVRWKTNEEPVVGEAQMMMRPCSETASLSEAVPFIEALSFFASTDTSLVPPLFGLPAWLKLRGIATPFADLSLQFGIFKYYRELGDTALSAFPNATLALALLIENHRAESFSFWLIPPLGVTRKISGHVEELRGQGFEIEVDTESGLIRTFGLGERWLQERGLI
jgi:hypothetical protein